MKKLPLLLAGGFLAASSFATPTQDMIQQYAKDLDVPVAALQLLVDAYHPQSGLTDPNAESAPLVTVKELKSMRDSNQLKLNAYYRIKAHFYSQAGPNVGLIQETDSIYVNSDYMVPFPLNSAVEALVVVTADNAGRARSLILIELTVADE
ncbi:hypothetical protein AGMMS49928_03260 [Spirochaetia bacterium]|nr:hypothetical protein AGMMS49928_03260 [Spirochaetia bacterium]